MERSTLDTQVMQGEEVPVQTLKDVLTGENPPQGEVLYHYLERLLDHALATRDTEAAHIVCEYMDADPTLFSALSDILDKALETQPDNVYAFIRARLAEGLDERWLARLREAATSALRVCVSDSDTETLVNWLTLVAREPTSYGLSDVLHSHILTARERAREDSELAVQLLALAIRRDPAALEALLGDEAFLAALPGPLGSILRDHQGDLTTLLQGDHGPEMFLIALVQLAHARVEALFTPVAIEKLWDIYTGQHVNGHLQETYRPETIINHLISDGVTWLRADALETLLRLVLRDGYSELFLELASHLTGREGGWLMMATALLHSGRPINHILDLVSQGLAGGSISHQEAANIYVYLLDAWDWPETALPLMEQLARTLKQHADVTVPTEALWKLLEAAADAKDERIAQVAARRLLAELEQVEDETTLTETLLQVYSHVQWSSAVRHYVTAWWRDFVRSQPLARLQRLEKLTEGKRTLEEAHAVVQTLIAFRKMLGKRSLQHFAEDVSTTYAILEALAEAFEPSPKRTIHFDQETVRAELQARDEELSPHERKILANNLKALAHLIGVMGDSRSKAPLMRRDEDFERQLMTGEQQPHSAIDAMKWLSGYLEGTQDKDDEDAD
jgi:hypothetical protein